jgi:hypothetical protein
MTSQRRASGRPSVGAVHEAKALIDELIAGERRRQRCGWDMLPAPEYPREHILADLAPHADVAVDLLLPRLDDPDEIARAQAAELLGLLGGGRAEELVPVLHRWAQSSWRDTSDAYPAIARLAPGHVLTLGLLDLPESVYIVEARWGGLVGKSIVSVNGGATNTTSVTLLGKGELLVTVVDAAGKPAPAAMVSLAQGGFPKQTAEGTTGRRPALVSASNVDAMGQSVCVLLSGDAAAYGDGGSPSSAASGKTAPSTSRGTRARRRVACVLTPSRSRPSSRRARCSSTSDGGLVQGAAAGHVQSNRTMLLIPVAPLTGSVATARNHIVCRTTGS